MYSKYMQCLTMLCMKKHYLIVLFFQVLITYTYSQVGIGTTSPQSQLDIRASNQISPNPTDGILIPKIDVFPLSNPTEAQDGMLVYVTGNGTISKGFYYWNNSLAAWTSIKGAEKINDLMDGKSDIDGSENGSSVFIGLGAGINDDSSDNQNTGIGFEAMGSNTSGFDNVASGYRSLFSNTTGSFNVANGFYTMFSNVSGVRNTASGYRSLYSNTIGSNNVGIGYQALFDNISGNNNVAIGYNSQYITTTSQGNVSIGSNALFHSGGNYNTVIGTDALTVSNVGDYNIAVGYSAMYSNTSGNNNIAIGSNALYSNTMGSNNVATGFMALNSNTNGNNNVALGLRTLNNNTTGNNNIATGTRALFSNTTGSNNIATGTRALYSNLSGSFNVSNGTRTLYLNTTGSYNVANGFRALNSNTIGNNNIANGYQTLYSNTTGSNNVASGYESLRNNSTGYDNIAYGTQSLYSNTAGDANVSIGTNSLYFNTVGINNTAIGTESGLNSNGDANIFLGYGAGYHETGSNRLYIENSDADANEALIYGEFDTDNLRFNGHVMISNANASHLYATLSLNNLEMANLGGNNLGLDGDIVPFSNSTFDIGNSLINQHWDEVVANTFVTYSDRRTKTHISELPYGLEDLMKLQPVSYSYNETISPNNRTRLGLIAQDVEKIIPEVVITEDVDIDPKTGEKIVVPGDYLAMSYIELIPVLIKAVQEQQKEIVALKDQLENYQFLEKRIKALEDKN